MKIKDYLFLFTAALTLGGMAGGQGTGRRYPSEMTVIRDSITGIPITVLTMDSANDSKIYQTHPQWTANGQYIVFRSDRDGSRPQAFAVDVNRGDIIQLTEDPDMNTGSLNLSRRKMQLYYTKGRRGEPVWLYVMDLSRLLEDSRNGNPSRQGGYERLITTLPDELSESGGFGLDCNEDKAYMGVSRGSRELGGIRWIDLSTGEIGTVVDVDFRMGHVQASPFVPGEIVYCHETGGDAPQRMWTVMGDGSGNRPLYKECEQEWVTHEVIVTPDLVYFNVMAHLPRLRKKATGIFSINLRNDEVRVLGQVGGRGFWHCNGSADGKWAAGDDFRGSIHLINLETSEISLLTTGHRMRPDHCHPTFSPDGKQILFQSGMLSNGKSLDLMLINLPGRLKG